MAIKQPFHIAELNFHPSLLDLPNCSRMEFIISIVDPFVVCIWSLFPVTSNSPISFSHLIAKYNQFYIQGLSWILSEL